MKKIVPRFDVYFKKRLGNILSFRIDQYLNMYRYNSFHKRESDPLTITISFFIKFDVERKGKAELPLILVHSSCLSAHAFHFPLQNRLWTPNFTSPTRKA